MPWQDAFPLFIQPPDSRPVAEIDREILDELEFHIEMRTQANVDSGMSPEAARQDAIRRFGDFDQIRGACRKTQLGERIMLQRVQTVLTLLLLGAVVFLGIQSFRSQRASEAATSQMLQALNALAEKPADKPQDVSATPAMIPNNTPPNVVKTVPASGDNNVDPSLTEIRVTYDQPMADRCWSWCNTNDTQCVFPQTTGIPHYEADKRTCVLPVKLEPDKDYLLLLNCENFHNFMSVAGVPAVSYVLRFSTRGPPPTPPQPATPQPAMDFPPADLPFAPAGTEDDAKALLAKMLKVNRPWLRPKAAEVSYVLLRKHEAAPQAPASVEKLGPFTTAPHSMPTTRVGSIITTPLHRLAEGNASHILTMIGKGEWKGLALVAIDVAFDPPIGCAVGLGGQSNTSYSAGTFGIAHSRLMIEPAKAIPLFIECQASPLPDGAKRCGHTWTFDPDFFEVDGGLAPKTVLFDDPNFVREQQTFQLVNGRWIFKQGAAWLGTESPGPHLALIQSMELVDLQVH